VRNLTPVILVESHSYSPVTWRLMKYPILARYITSVICV